MLVMRNIILFTVFFLSLIVIPVTYSRPDGDEQLAWRMSRSPNFIAIINAGKQMATRIKSMPDSAKNQLKQFKARIYSIDRKTGFNFTQKRDLVMKLIRSNPMMTDSEMIANAKNMDPSYKRFNSEFPEFRKMPKEERTLVFKKAFTMLRKIYKLT